MKMVRFATLVVAAGVLLVQPGWLFGQTLIKLDNSIPANSDSTCSNGRMAPGTAGKGDSWQAYFPNVLRDDDGTYKMWYSGHDGANARIYYATSSNGIDWVKYNNTKITATLDAGVAGPAGCLPLGSSTMGDATHTHYPCVIKDDGIYKMWYGGLSGAPALWRFYYATSSNGAVWTKYDNSIATTNTNGRLPVGAGGAGDANAMYGVWVIKDGTTYKMWYAGQGGTPVAYRIYHATSPDGLTWTKYNTNVELSNDVTGTQGRLPLGVAAGRGDVLNVNAPRVLKQGLTYLMWYQGTDALTNSRTFLATSIDGGLTWTKKNNQIPVPSTVDTGSGSTDGRITLGSAGMGDDASTAGPSPVDEGRTIRFWYYGGKSGTATSRVYSATWTKDYPTIRNAMASNVTDTTVTLAGSLVATGQAPATVRVYWGTNDAGLSWAQWGHTNEFSGYPAEGLLTTNLTGLASNTLYYYRWFATNQYGSYMADPVGTFVTAGLTVRATDPSASESGADPGVFTVSRPPALTNAALAVNYTLGGTATNGADYQTLSGSVTIPAGATNATVTVTPIDDGVFEPSRTVVLTISGGGIGGDSATVTLARHEADSWGRQLPLGFAGYTAGEVLTNFPVLVMLGTNVTGFSYAEFLSGTNADLRFADSNLSYELSYEVEQWDTNGVSSVWVRLPTLASSNDTIWALWGKPGVAAPAYTANGAVWDTNFCGVWHMTDPNPPNSVAGGVRGTKTNTVTAAAGQVSTALYFANTSTMDYVMVDGTGPQDPDVLTLSAWVKVEPTTDGGVLYGHRSESTRLIQLTAQATNDARLQLRGSGNNLQNVVFTNDLRSWTHLVGVFDNVSDRHILYVNGLPRATNTYDFGSETMTSTKQTLGTYNNGSYLDGLEGWLDEMRVSTSVRSAGWVWAEWMSQASNSLFVATSGTQTGGAPMVVSWPASGIGDTLASLDGTLFGAGRSDTTVTLYWGTSDGGTVESAWATNVVIGTAVAPGPLSFVVTGLDNGGSYVYRYCASNSYGVCWSAARIFVTGGIAVRASDSVSIEQGLDGGAFTISRAPTATNTALTVYFTLGGTASNGLDYASLAESVTLPVGASSAVIPVVPIQDAVADNNETVTLTLQPGGYSISALSNATVTLFDARFDSWMRSAWIVFSGYGRSDTLTNFPVLVTFSTNVPGFRYADVASPDGSDLRFTDATQTNVLNHEIEQWDTNGASQVWVQVPRLVGTDTRIWAYWGRSNVAVATYSTNGATWDSSFKGVWHMARTNTPDATAYANHGASFGNISVTGTIGTAQGFAGSNYVQIAHSSSLAFGDPALPFAMSAWINTTTAGENFMGKGRTGNVENIEYAIRHSGTTVAMFRWKDTSAVPATYLNGYTTWPLTNGQWHHVAVVNEGSAMHRVYADGVLLVSDTSIWSNNTANTQPVELGRYSNHIWGTNYYTGKLDEMRIEGAGRSSNWMWACWMNAASNATFGVMGAPGAPIVSNMPVTSVTTASATLNGYLALTGTAATAVMVYWGPNNGGSSPAAWSNVTVFPGTPGIGPLATNVSLPANGVTYYYRYCATNLAGSAWAPSTAFLIGDYVTVEVSDPNASEQALDPGTFAVRRPAGTTAEAMTVNYTLGGTASNGADYAALGGTVTIPAGASYATVTVTPLADTLVEGAESVVLTLDPGFYAVGPSNQATLQLGDMSAQLWTHRMPITFSGYTRPETLSNFPALVTFNTNMAGFGYADVAFTNASDLVFVDSTETQYLDYEIERWDTNGISCVWVRLPALASSNDFIWAYWGNPFAPGIAPCRTNGAVWNTGYRAVWHLNETVADEASTAVHYDATANRRNGTQSGNDDVSGVIANGQAFDGNDLINVGAVMTTNAYTKELWVRLTGNGNLFSGGANDHAFWVPTGYLQSGHNGTWNYVADPVAFPVGSWQHVAVSYDPAVSSGRMVLYRNGLQVASASSVPRPNSSPTSLLGSYNSGTFFTGYEDEARLSWTARSSNWIWACYMNTASNGVFNSNGVVRIGPVISNAAPTGVSISNATLNGYLSSTGATPTTVTVYWGTEDGGLYHTTWAHTNQIPGNPGTGMVSVTVGPLIPDVTYYYRFYAVNSEGESWGTPVGTLLTAPVTVQATDPAAAMPGDDPGQFMVYRSATATGLPLTVNYTVGGTAVGNEDYVALSGSVTLPAGATNAAILLTPLTADEAFQPPTLKTVTVTLSGGTCVVGTPDSATVTINQTGPVYGWHRQMLVTFRGYDRSEALADFPALVRLHTGLTGFRYGDFLSRTNADLRFVSGDRRQELNYEIDTWNTNGTSQVWVQVPAVSNSAASFWVCWGKAGVTAPACTTNGAVWSSRYAGVWHLNETGTGRADATPNRTGGTVTGTALKRDGMVGQADWYYYPNGDDFVTVSNSPAVENVQETNYTLEAWAKPMSIPPGSGGTNDAYAVFTKHGYHGGLVYSGGGGGRFLFYHYFSSGLATGLAANVSSTTNEFHQVAGVIDRSGGTMRLYVDGRLAAEKAITPNAAAYEYNQNNWRFGVTTSSGVQYKYPADAMVDEPRISSVARSSNWLWACWMNLASNTVLLDYGPVLPQGTSFLMR